MKRLLTHLSCLTRLAMTLVLVLSAMGAGAQTYTVTLKAGEGTGSDVTISNNVAANVAASRSAAKNGQFWQEGDKWFFKYPDCPSTFSPPDAEKVLLGWNGPATKPGTEWQITGDMTLTAYWGIEDFCQYEQGGLYDFNYRVTSRSPNEVKMRECGHIIHNDGTLVIPATVGHDGEDYSVTSIGDNAFNDVNGVTSVSIPASVRSIGEKAFNGCDDLVTVTFAEGSQLASIVKNAFYGCDNLTTVTFAEGSQLASIEKNAFETCFNLATLTLQSNPTIGNGAFPNETNVTMTLPANPANGAYWTTFYNDGYRFQADENTKVYKATVNGSELTLHEVEDRIVNRFTAVILKSSGKPVMTRTTSASANTDDNDLEGKNKRTACSSILTGAFAGGTIYVMGKPEGKEMGFYEYTGEYMPGGKAYIRVPSAGAPTRGLSFVEEEVTNIEDVTTDNSQQTTDSWYTLSGVKLTGMPTTKGVYLYNGHKYVVE